jgi:hypothetical protein
MPSNLLCGKKLDRLPYSILSRLECEPQSILTDSLQISTQMTDMCKITHQDYIMNTATPSAVRHKHTVSTDEHAHSSMRKLNPLFAEMNLLYPAVLGHHANTPVPGPTCTANYQSTIQTFSNINRMCLAIKP